MWHVQGCSLSPILFSVFINDLLKEVEQAKLGVQLSSGKKIGGMLFADDFVGVSDSKESLKKLIDVVHVYCTKWRLKANVSKSAVMVFSKNSVEGGWKCRQHKLPEVSSYTYLDIDFACNGAWDVHLKRVLDNGRKKVNQLHSIISNRDIHLSAHRLLLLSVINPRRACAARVTVVGLCVCLFVCCLSTTILALQATRRLMSDTNSFSATRA